MEKAKCIVFDVGGVFRDSKKALYLCFNQAFARYNIPIQFDEDIVYHLRGAVCNTRRRVGRIFERRRWGRQIKRVNRQKLSGWSEEEERLLKNIEEEYKRLFSSPELKDLVVLYPDAESSVTTFKEKNYILGVLSNGTQKSLERDLGHLFSFFEFTVTEAKKPDTKAYLEALKGINIKPEETIYVGDAVSDVVMAKRAGSYSVAVLCGMGTESQLRAAKPDAIFSSLGPFADSLPAVHNS